MKNKRHVLISDLKGQKFTNKSEFISWISNFTNVSYLTDIEFYDGVAKFNCPINTDFSLSDDFCAIASDSEKIRFEDKWGLISNFGLGCFVQNIHNNNFGSYDNLSEQIYFGAACFSFATGNNILNGVINLGDNCFEKSSPSIKNMINTLKSCGSRFGADYEGCIEILNFGTNSYQDLPNDILTTNKMSWIKTLQKNEFSNSGLMDEDLLNAKTNMTNSNSKILYL